MIAQLLFPLAVPRCYSYAVPPDFDATLRVGCQVKAPIGRQVRVGIVLRLLDVPPPDAQNHPLKALLSIETSLPFIYPTAIAFWLWLADYYMCPIGVVAKMALPSWRFKKVPVNPLATEAIPETREDKRPPLVVQGYPRTAYYDRLVKDTIAHGGQALILCPSKAACDTLYAQWTPTPCYPLHVFHSERTMHEQNVARRHLYAGTPCAVLGLQNALLLPFSRLDLVVVEEESSLGHKETSAVPYIHSRNAALMLAHLHGAHVVMGTVAPSLQTVFHLYAGKYELCQLPTPTALMHLIDTTRAAKRKEMIGALHQDVEQAIADCSAQGRAFICVHPAPTQWEYSEQYPVCAPHQLATHLNADTDLVVFVAFEALLARKNFQAHEWAWQWVALASARAKNVFVQTAEPDNPFYQALEHHFPEPYLKELLGERQAFQYPPFTRLIAITISHTAKTIVQEKAMRLYESLAQWAAQGLPDGALYGPYTPGERTINTFSARLLVVIPRNQPTAGCKAHLFSILESVPVNPARLRIDVDPL